jgi:hypothetical protein
METKKCSGCKTTKSLSDFYKNKLVLDGHSNYCIACTKENSKKYFQRKKDRIAKEENDNLIKMSLLNNYNNGVNDENMDSLMRLLMIEKLTKSIMDEVNSLKTSMVKSDEVVIN